MITLWSASMKDEAQILAWRNDPFIYSKGYSGQPVRSEDHAVWLYGQVSPGDHGIFIIQNDKEDIGVIRYEVDKFIPAAMISIFMPEKNCGKGYGTEAISQCCVEIRARWPSMRIIAEILSDNPGSLRAFAKAGFTEFDDGMMEYRL